MDTFELDSDAFYICTEVSPRNFVVQKAIQIDRSQIERMVGKFETSMEKAASSSETSAGTSTADSPGTSSATSGSGVVNGVLPKPPPLPYWFNRECKSTLMMIGPQPTGPTMHHHPSSSNQNQFVPAMPGLPPMSREEVKQQLKAQLEYYFSRENLITDRYLKCQMDEEHYVPLNVLAGFPKILRLTGDIDLIVEALRDSAIVEMDENEEKVRAIAKRTTIIIREIPEEFREEVERLLADGPPFAELKYVCNDSWYVTYHDELETQVAYVAVQHKKNEITQKPVCARIKAGGPPSTAVPNDGMAGENGRFAALGNGEMGVIQLRELGQTLSEFGFVPVATFRPEDTILSHFEYLTRTCRFSGNNVSYQHPPTMTLPPPHLQQQHQQMPPPPPSSQSQYYYPPSSLSTTPRNFDELSTASSNSTRTTNSNYTNRNGAGPRNGGFSNSNDWRGRVNSAGARFQNHQNGEANGMSQNPNPNPNPNQNRQPQQNGRGNWRSGFRATNGHSGHSGQSQNGYNNRQNGQRSWWPSNENNHQHNNSYNERRHTGGFSTSYRHNHNAPVSSSSSSSASSRYFSPDAIETPTNSVPSTPPPSTSQYNVPTPTDLPSPPVWPAPNFDRRRKSSEASSTTITTTNTTTNTLTPSTPVTPPIHRPTFVETKGTSGEQSTSSARVETSSRRPNGVEKEKVQSPTSAPSASSPSTSSAAPSFAFEETAFPSLPKKVEPVKPPQKPTFR